ncbi:hypothetical protein DERF_010001 [Dermatophagoides farinae]|uniref:Uncharacterized protein n=1 Tax=Dermatophagoides farinae TaxID=6954 RepID=A0A922HYF0_DERFA|nr:hypothetical protein DERF_010001 [Dermatophagoides farinae]
MKTINKKNPMVTNENEKISDTITTNNKQFNGYYTGSNKTQSLILSLLTHPIVIVCLFICVFQIVNRMYRQTIVICQKQNKTPPGHHHLNCQ